MFTMHCCVCVHIVFTAYFYAPIGIFIEQKSEKPRLAIHLSVFPEPLARVCACVCACLHVCHVLVCVCVCVLVRAPKRQHPLAGAKAETDT